MNHGSCFGRAFGNHLHPRRLFSRNWENGHGTEVFEKGIRQSRACDEEAQGRHSEERPLRQESHKPQAGDRDRSLRGEGRGQESPEEGREAKEGGQEAEVEEVTNHRATVIASEAKQSRAAERGVTGLLRRFAPRKKLLDRGVRRPPLLVGVER